MNLFIFIQIIFTTLFVFAGTYTPVKDFSQAHFASAAHHLEACARLNSDKDVVVAKMSYDQLEEGNSPEKFLKEYLFDRYMDMFSSYSHIHLAYSLPYFKQVGVMFLGLAQTEEQKEHIRAAAHNFELLHRQGHQLLVYEGYLGLNELKYSFMMVVDLDDRVLQMIAVQN